MNWPHLRVLRVMGYNWVHDFLPLLPLLLLRQLLKNEDGLLPFSFVGFEVVGNTNVGTTDYSIDGAGCGC